MSESVSEVVPSKCTEQILEDPELAQQLQTLHLEKIKAEEATGKAEVEASDAITFSPPVYIQRYSTVKDVILKFLEDPKYQDPQNGRTVMEVGCAEFGMHLFMKSILEIGRIIYVDIDEQLLLDKKYNLKPFPAEYLQRHTRPKPLVVEAYAGDINFVDTRILQQSPGVWGVIAIELIEHLYPSDLRGFEVSVFGVINPDVVVVTTPNSEFNVVFNLPPGKFRHWDHKYEWTRKEFQDWCDKIVNEYKEYTYTIHGIGSAPENIAMTFGDIGCVSQMAIFEKVQPPSEDANRAGKVQDGAYKLVESLEYPNYIETRTLEEIVMCDIKYLQFHYWLCKSNIESCMEKGIEALEFNLSDLIVMLPTKTPKASKIDVPFLRQVLTNAGGYQILTRPTGEFYLHVPVPYWDLDTQDISDEEDMDDNDLGQIPNIVNNSLNSSNFDTDESWD